MTGSNDLHTTCTAHPYTLGESRDVTYKLLLDTSPIIESKWAKMELVAVSFELPGEHPPLTDKKSIDGSKAKSWADMERIYEGERNSNHPQQETNRNSDIAR